jgi:hypothetical protein
LTRLLFLEPVALTAKLVDPVEHPVKHRLGRGAGYPGMLKLPDLAALPPNLAAHALDLGPNDIDIRHRSPLSQGRGH